MENKKENSFNYKDIIKETEYKEIKEILFSNLSISEIKEIEEKYLDFKDCNISDINKKFLLPIMVRIINILYDKEVYEGFPFFSTGYLKSRIGSMFDINQIIKNINNSYDEFKEFLSKNYKYVDSEPIFCKLIAENYILELVKQYKINNKFFKYNIL